MLIADVLNQEALLNDFDIIGTLQFIAGDAFRIVIRIKQPQRTDKLRFVPPNTAIMTFVFNNTDGTTVELTATSFPDDRSMWYRDITSDESAEFLGGNFTFELDLLGDGTKIVHGYVQNGLALIVTGTC